MRHMNPIYPLLGSLVAAAAVAAPAIAAEDAIHPKLQNRFYLDAGGYWPSMDTSISIDGPYEINPGISLENDLGLEDRPALPFALMNIRLGDRWRIEAEGFKIGRDKTRVIDTVIPLPPEYGDDIPINTAVTSHFDTTVYRLSLGYSFLKRPDSEMGVALGAHVTEFDLGIQEVGGLRGGATDALAPLPTLGIYGYYALSPKWLVNGRADVFSLEYDRYDGTLMNINLGVEYQLTKWLGMGLGYRYVEMDLDAKADGLVWDPTKKWVGNFNYQYSGPTLYMSLTF